MIPLLDPSHRPPGHRNKKSNQASSLVFVLFLCSSHTGSVDGAEILIPAGEAECGQGGIARVRIGANESGCLAEGPLIGRAGHECALLDLRVLADGVSHVQHC